MGSDTLLRHVGLIGDVHGEADALAAVLEFLRGIPSLDVVLCTGDIPGSVGAGDTDRCCCLLRDAGALTIRGNHDRWYGENESLRVALGRGDDGVTAESRAFMAALPPTRTFRTPQGPLLLCHGLGVDDMAGIYPGGSDEEIAWTLQKKELATFRFIVAGHTHRRMIRSIGNTTIINPGTLSWAYQPCFAVADLDGGTVRFYGLAPDTHEITPAETVPLPLEN